MEQKRLAKLAATDHIIAKLRKWSQKGKRIVVGLDGYSGIGKTTVARQIGEFFPGVSVLHMDDFACTANTKEFLEPQIAKNIDGLQLMWKPEDGLLKLRMHIKQWKKKPGTGILLVEGIFLYHPDVLNDIWDKRIYIDGNMKKADMRRVHREKERWGDKYFPETHPDSFARLFKLAHRRYRVLCRPKRNADLIVRAIT